MNGVPMKRYVLSIAALVALGLPLASCATSKTPKLGVCDGNPKHRRNANPYGSVLPGAPAPEPMPQDDGKHPPMLPPPPPPPSPQTSAVAVPSYFASC